MVNPYLSPATGPAPGYFDVDVTCPECGGEGYVPFQPDPLEDGWEPATLEEGVVPCEACGTWGEITVEDRGP